MVAIKEPRRDSLSWLDWKCPTEKDARQFFEKLIWPEGAHCPHCGSFDVWRFRDKGRKSRDGLFECKHCCQQFTVTTKTPMHSTKLPLKVWLRAIYLILISSKGVSSIILGKQLGVRQPTAWKIAHAIREMADDRDGENALLDQIVEVDTTYMGGPPRKSANKSGIPNKRGRGTNRPQVAVAASRDGRIAAEVIRYGDSANIGRFLGRFVSPEAKIMSDDDTAIAKAARTYTSHQTVTHRHHEFADGDVHANTVESVASLFKRAQLGVFHFLSELHLQRYLDEIVFRANQRTVKLKRGKGEMPGRLELQYIDFEQQLRNLLVRAVGRQVRRSLHGGISWPNPVASGFKPAPSSIKLCTN